MLLRKLWKISDKYSFDEGMIKGVKKDESISFIFFLYTMIKGIYKIFNRCYNFTNLILDVIKKFKLQ